MTISTMMGKPQIDSLFRQHYSWLNRWVNRQRRTFSSGDDVASEVFLRLVAQPDHGDLREPRAMMTTIAKRVIYDLRRRNDLWASYEADLLAAPKSMADSPEAHAIVVEALRAVDEMLAGMSPKARAAFLHSRIDGMKQEEIAAKLGVSVSMVQQYITQGLRRAYALKQSLS